VPRYLIIDGYNAISKIGELEAQKDSSLEDARTAFIRILKDFMAQKNLFEKIFVIFDSKERALGVRRHLYGKVEVLFTTEHKDADSVIVDMLRNASGEDKISVASDDNFVRNHARVYGCDVISIRQLRDKIILKKPALGSRIHERGLHPDKIKDINEELKKRWRLK